ncbi:MAG: ribosome maturation factor RimM [Alphaproteobacteria bacterium]|nr:ribosome maturation factor RimM [Alphaproteobacteria bacterium]
MSTVQRVPQNSQPARVCVGVVAGAHGVHGAVRIKSFTAVPEDIARYGPLDSESGRARYTVRLIGMAKGAVVAQLSGIADRNAAEALRGLRLYLPRAALPPTEADEYYHADLIGLQALLEDGTPVGRVQAVHDFGAGDTLEVARDGQSPAMIPFTRAVVPVVDLAAGRLILAPPAGLLDPAPKDEESAAPSPGEAERPA